MNVIFPRIPVAGQFDETRLKVLFEELYRDWRAELDAKNPPPPIENVRFGHDINWNKRFWSIQCAHDQNHWGWKVVAVLIALASL